MTEKSVSERIRDLTAENNAALDNWEHRSEGMRCKSCMWYAPKQKIGRCRRRAPTMNGYPVD